MQRFETMRTDLEAKENRLISKLDFIYQKDIPEQENKCDGGVYTNNYDEWWV